MSQDISLYQTIVDAVTNAAKNLLGGQTTAALIKDALDSCNSQISQVNINDASVDLSTLSLSDADELNNSLNSFLEKFTQSLSSAINPIVISNLLSSEIRDTVAEKKLEDQIKKLDLDKKLLVLEGIMKK